MTNCRPEFACQTMDRKTINPGGGQRRLFNSRDYFGTKVGKRKNSFTVFLCALASLTTKPGLSVWFRNWFTKSSSNGSNQHRPWKLSHHCLFGCRRAARSSPLRIIDSSFSFPGSSAERVLSCGGVRLRALSAFFPFSLLLPFPPRASLGPKPKGTDPEGSGRISDPKIRLGAGTCRVSAG